MKSFESIEAVLEFAIAREEEAALYYQYLASKMKVEHMKQTFLDFAEEERGHKAKLMEVREGTLVLTEGEAVIDLKIADYTVKSDKSDEDLDYQEALVLAMKREKASFRLYTNLAEMTPDEKMKALFRAMAQEEAKHKLRFELEYDEQIMTDN